MGLREIPTCGRLKTEMGVSVYTVTRRETGDKYVGISKDPHARWRQHRWAAKNRPHGYFHNAVGKYGPEAFDWQVVAELPTLPEAQIAERILIACEQPEYNLSEGGDGNWGYVPTAEARAKIGAAHRGRKHPPRSAECRRAIGDAHRGKQHSEQTKQAISAALSTPEMKEKLGAHWRGAKRPEHAEKLRGRKASDETCAKISAALTGKPKSPEAVAKTKAFHTGRKRSAETCARIGASKRGMKHSAETRAKMSASHQARLTAQES